MGEAGRKLTIRMPDSDRLASAEVVSLHVEPGGRAAVGAPVMTLRARRREHIVRAPRPGRIVPLVGPGDRVRGGDPLYVLNVDEAALAQQNSDARALIAIERTRWANDTDAERIQVLQRGQRKSTGARGRAFTAWLGPVMAIAFYVAACFAFLPLLTTLSDASAPWGRLLLMAAAVLLGLLIFRLYAPRYAGLPRNVVKLVAIAWVGIAAVAVLHRPTGPDDLTLGRAGERMVGMFWPRETPLVVPQPSPSPVPVESSGVYAGPPDKPAPDHAEPRNRLAERAGTTPDEHGVTVRPWGRQNPVMASGEPPRHMPADDAPAAPDAHAQVATAAPRPLGRPVLAGAPPAAPAPPAQEPDAGGAVPAQIAEAMPVPDAESVGELALAAGRDPDAALSGRSSPRLEAGAAPQQVAVAAPEAGWLSLGLPVVADEGAAAPVLPDRAPAGAPDGTAGTAGVVRAEPSRPAGSSGPEPVLAAALRAGGSEWMERAAEASADAPAGAASDGGPAGASAGAVLSSLGVPGEAGGAPDAVPVPSVPGAVVPGAVVPGAALPAEGLEIPAPVAALTAADTVPAGARESGAAVLRGAPPAAPDAGAGPEPVLAAALRAGRSDWMEMAREPADEASVAPEALGPAAPGAAPSLAALGAGAGRAARAGAAGDGASSRPMQPALPVPSALPAAGSNAEPAAEAALSAGAAGQAPAPGAAPGGLAVAMAPSPAPAAPASPEELAERRLLFLYYDDPRMESHPRQGDEWLPALGPEAAGAIRSARVEEVREVVEVTDWCTAEYPTAALSDRIRLLEVRLEVEPSGIDRVESELPVLAGGPPGFFHNHAPLLGGAADAPLIEQARGFLGIEDQGTPDGRYFDSEPGLARALELAGCRRIEWNGGDGPVNEIGRELERRLAG